MGGCWQTSYLFLHPRELLQGSYQSGLKVLHSTERSLKKGGWGEQYSACIEEMLQRKVVRKVPKEEMDEFIRSGKTVTYLPHLCTGSLQGGCRTTVNSLISLANLTNHPRCTGTFQLDLQTDL